MTPEDIAQLYPYAVLMLIALMLARYGWEEVRAAVKSNGAR